MFGVLEVGFEVVKGCLLLNFVIGEEECLEFVLFLVKKYNVFVVVIFNDDIGIFEDLEVCFVVVKKIVEWVVDFGILVYDIVVDLFVMLIGVMGIVGL